MKKEIKLCISILFVMIVAVFALPTATIFASEVEYGYVTGKENFKSKNLEFSDIEFYDNSNDSSMSFGLLGEIKNTSSNNILLETRIFYYDKSNNLVAATSKTMEFQPNEQSKFLHMSSINIINTGYSVPDIYTYKIYMDELTVIHETNSVSDYLEKYDYYIDNYDIEIVVNENNTFDITEKISTYFNEKKHGIYRTIPLKNEVERLDGTTSENRAKITNLEVLNDEFSISKSYDEYNIKIGSASKTITGKKDYTIKYHYNIGKDKAEDYDELYFNIIGNEWDTCINNVNFTIKMPKEFDASKLGFSLGYKGSTNNDDIIYNVSGNVITGKYTKGLKENQGLTVRLELPEGYFVGYESTIDNKIYLMVGLPIIFLVISIILWRIFGKDDAVVETVEFYPPEGFNSLEVGYLYKGKADNEDVISLLIYLANKGYIKITEIEEEALFIKSKGYKITKLKEYDGNNLTEKLFLNGLFTARSSYKRYLGKNKEEIKPNEVTLDELENKFYRTINKILKKINSKQNKNQIFEKSTGSKSVIVAILIIISLITIVAIPTLEYAGTEELFMTLFITLFYVPFYSVGLSSKTKGFGKVFWLGFTIMHSSVFFAAMPIFNILITDKTFLYAFLVGIACIVGMIICFKFMSKRTEYGIEILGKIQGFKNFLETVEKERLEALVMENPTYFYDILPYTYVLGISDKWIKKFEVISLQEPDWYTGTSAFSAATFGSAITKTMSSVTKSMSSSPSSSGGGSGRSGGSSGGGSSGGGSGGGGGGSW